MNEVHKLLAGMNSESDVKVDNANSIHNAVNVVVDNDADVMSVIKANVCENRNDEAEFVCESHHKAIYKSQGEFVINKENKCIRPDTNRLYTKENRPIDNGL